MTIRSIVRLQRYGYFADSVIDATISKRDEGTLLKTLAKECNNNTKNRVEDKNASFGCKLHKFTAEIFEINTRKGQACMIYVFLIILFSSLAYNAFHYCPYLSFGSCLALIATIAMFVRKSKERQDTIQTTADSSFVDTTLRDISSNFN